MGVPVVAGLGLALGGVAWSATARAEPRSTEGGLSSDGGDSGCRSTASSSPRRTIGSLVMLALLLFGRRRGAR